MSAMSFVHASVRGAFLFVAATASLALAFSFAVAGPPTPSEMTALQVFGRAALGEASDVLKTWGHNACAELEDACRGAPPIRPQVASTAADAQDPAAPPTSLVPVDAPSPPQTTASPSPDVNLLGGEDAPADVSQPRRRVASPSAPQASRVQRAPPRPAARMRSLRAPRSAPIAHAPPAAATHVVAAPAHTQRAATPAEDPIAALVARVATLLASSPPPVVTPHTDMPPAPKTRVAVEPAQEEQARDETAIIDDNAETDEAADDQRAAGDDESTATDDADDRDQYRRYYYDGDGYHRHRWRRRYWGD